MTRSYQLKSLFPSSSYHIHICGLHGDLSPVYLPLLGIFWQIQIKKQNIIVSELQGLSKTTESLTLGLEVQLEFDTRLIFGNIAFLVTRLRFGCLCREIAGYGR